MDENHSESATAEQKSSLNPLLIIVILIIIAAVGVMLWLGSNKSNTKVSEVVPTTTVTQPEQPTGTATESAKGDSVMAQAITVEAGSFYFKPNEIKVKKGDKVKITITNKGGFHNFAIDAFNVKSENIPGGGSTTVEFTPDKTGTFEFYCAIGNHRQMGMKGTLIVE